MRAVTHQTITRRMGWVLLSLTSFKWLVCHMGHGKVATTDGSTLFQKFARPGDIVPSGGFVRVWQASERDGAGGQEGLDALAKRRLHPLDKLPEVCDTSSRRCRRAKTSGTLVSLEMLAEVGIAVMGRR